MSCPETHVNAYMSMDNHTVYCCVLHGVAEEHKQVQYSCGWWSGTWNFTHFPLNCSLINMNRALAVPGEQLTVHNVSEIPKCPFKKALLSLSRSFVFKVWLTVRRIWISEKKNFLVTIKIFFSRHYWMYMSDSMSGTIVDYRSYIKR